MQDALARHARAPASALPAYVRRRPEDTVLYAMVEEHAPAFFAQLDERGGSLPEFVHQEFERYLCCGRLEEGFVRVACTGCRHEHLVAFSCTGQTMPSRSPTRHGDSWRQQADSA
jgi:hypothetical protein